jgi:hypothetical protein
MTQDLLMSGDEHKPSALDALLAQKCCDTLRSDSSTSLLVPRGHGMVSVPAAETL